MPLTHFFKPLPSMKRIDFCVIGVQKSASTWLHNCLNEHPEIVTGGGKREENYFGGPLFKELGEEWFWSLFAEHDQQKIVGNSSVDYIYDPAALAMLKNRLPAIKPILVLREPMARSISAYSWLFRQNLIPNLELEVALDQSAKMQNSDVIVTGEVEQQLFEIVDRSLYYNQLLQLEKLNLLKDTHIIFYEDISKNPKKVIKDLFAYLGVSDFVPLSLHRRPKTTSKLAWLNHLQRKVDTPFLSKIVSAASEISGKILGSKSQSVQVENEALSTLFKDDLTQLQTLLGKGNFLSSNGLNHLSSWIKMHS